MTRTMALLDKKAEGHQLIDELVKTGLPRTWVYAGLAKRLGCLEGDAHFSKMRTMQEVERANYKLSIWLEGRTAFLRNQRERRERKQLTYHTTPESLRIALMPKPWWRKALERIGL